MKFEFRIITAIFAVFAIVLLQQYYITNISSYSTHLDEESLNIGKYEGKEFTKEGTILSIDEDTFIIKDPSYSFEIFNPNKELRKGDYGEFLLKVENNRIICKDYRIFHYHYIKYIISFLGVILVAVILLKELRLTKRGFDYA